VKDIRSEAGVAGAVRHAANNLSMVVLSNLDLLTRSVTIDTPAGRQVTRAREACERLLAILVPYTRLSREPVLDRVAPETPLRALLPLLTVVAGGHEPVTLEAEAVQPVPLPRPALDLALLEWAEVAAAESPRGTVLRIALLPGEDGVVIRLSPNPGGAGGALVEVAALVGGSATLGADMAELRLPYQPG
jgi:hypothetical protein